MTEVHPNTILWSLLRQLQRLWAPVLFVWIALLPVIARIQHPTLLGDDVTRVVELIEMPFRALLFRPFNEHFSPLFDFVSWTTWEAVGHDLRLAPLGFCVASVFPWVVLLVLMAAWLKRETGSRTAALIAVALAAQSPLALEAMWWYSAASFTYAVLGVQAALLGASVLAIQPGLALALIATGSALGPAGSMIGALAMPLAAMRTVIDTTTSWRRKTQGLAAAFGGFGMYLLARELAGVGLFRTVHTQNNGVTDPMAGLGYALTVPGRVLWPTMIGMPWTWTIKAFPTVLVWPLGLLALTTVLTLALKPRVRWNRRLVLVGGAMIYLGYALTYCARAGLARSGQWTEEQLLYTFGGRYHLLPLLGACAVIAAILSAVSGIRRSDVRLARSAGIGIIVGLLAMVAAHNDQDFWRWMLREPDQQPTLSALHHVGELARAEGISREQLTRIFDPVFRPWNGSVRLNPYYFHHMKLVVQAPVKVDKPLPDEEARRRLFSRLTLFERSVLVSGACVSMSTRDAPKPNAASLAIARKVRVQNVREASPGHFRVVGWPAFLEYEFDIAAEAHFLVLPGLAADQDLAIYWRDETDYWRSLQQVCWLKTPAPTAAPAIDLDRLVNWPAGRRGRIRVAFTCPGELALQQPPRLVR